MSTELVLVSPLLFPHHCCLPRASCAGRGPSSFPIYPMMSPIPVLPDITRDITTPSLRPHWGWAGEDTVGHCSIPLPSMELRGGWQTQGTSPPEPSQRSRWCPRAVGSHGKHHEPGWDALREYQPLAAAVPSALGPDVRAAEADTAHLVRVLVSIAELTTSPRPAGGRRSTSGSNHSCHASRRYGTAERRTRNSPRSLPQPQHTEHQHPPATSCIRMGARPIQGRALCDAGSSLGKGMGLSAAVGVWFSL